MAVSLGIIYEASIAAGLCHYHSQFTFKERIKLVYTDLGIYHLNAYSMFTIILFFYFKTIPLLWF
jgi:hypothetical protein